MKQYIKSISDEFIKEAKSSPRMLEDLAAMERYMSESYDGRTFVELLQNADDADSTRVKVFIVDNTLIVANDGRAFNENDMMSICRSGASRKQRGENIGYRGVGFKSATTISTEIVIHSAGTYFTFSKTICAKELGKNIAQVPTVRIPFLFDESKLSSGIKLAIDECKNDGFNTFFIFLHSKNEKFLGELDGFNAGWLLFLKNISNVNIECGSFRKKCALSRDKLSDTDTLLSVNGSKNKWYIVSKNNVSLAFKYDSVEGLVPCDADEAVFHCFLPTMDKTGFPFKANADFSTDPSRKHIIQDDSTNRAIYSIQDLFAELCDRIAKNKEIKYYRLFSLITTYTTLNSFITQFEAGILDKLRSLEWVPLNNGQYVRPTTAKTCPKWLDSDERGLIFTNKSALSSKIIDTDFVEKTEKIEVLLNKLGASEITIFEISSVLSNADSVRYLTPQLWGKVFVYCYRALAMDEKSVGILFVPLENGYVQLSEATINTELDVAFVSTIKNLLNAKEAENLAISYEVFAKLHKKKEAPIIKKNEDSLAKGASATKLAINKWKTPIQNCITVETLNGNTAKDVSKKSDEYAIISTTPTGDISYITVKTVGVLGDSFKLTESEYSAAQKYGQAYKVYLFTTDTSNIKYDIITNPIDTVSMKKVVKEWEWICNCHSEVEDSQDSIEGVADTFEITNISTVDFDAMDGEEFERFCARLLMNSGYEDVSLTKGSGDQGIDIIAYRDGIKYGIQCKCYSSDIGNAAVQEVFAGKTFYKCNVGIVLTNQHFSPSAIQLAEANGIVLWGREFLLKLIRKSQ